MSEHLSVWAFLAVKVGSSYQVGEVQEVQQECKIAKVSFMRRSRSGNNFVWPAVPLVMEASIYGQHFRLQWFGNLI